MGRSSIYFANITMIITFPDSKMCHDIVTCCILQKVFTCFVRQLQSSSSPFKQCADSSQAKYKTNIVRLNNPYVVSSNGQDLRRFLEQVCHLVFFHVLDKLNFILCFKLFSSGI